MKEPRTDVQSRWLIQLPKGGLIRKVFKEYYAPVNTIMRYIDMITEAMQPLSAVYTKIKQGFDGNLDSSCYNRVGRVLRERGDQLSNAVVAFYGIGDQYNHCAIETEDGRLIDERQAPHKMRAADGRNQRADMQRSTLKVPEVLRYLRA